MLLLSKATPLNRAPPVSLACLPRSLQERSAWRRLLFPLISATNHACMIAEVFPSYIPPSCGGELLSCAVSVPCESVSVGLSRRSHPTLSLSRQSDSWSLISADLSDSCVLIEHEPVLPSLSNCSLILREQPPLFLQTSLLTGVPPSQAHARFEPVLRRICESGVRFSYLPSVRLAYVRAHQQFPFMSSPG
jgi:hypothetical protein